MGRAMLIICAAVLISLGIVSVSTSEQGEMLIKKGIKYAYKVTAENAAHTAIQIAMQKINEDDTWAETHDISNPYTTTISGASTELYVEYLNDYKNNGYWESDSIRMVSKAKFEKNNEVFEAQVTSVYLIAQFSNLVPGFKGALTAATQNAVISSGGSASISGMAPTGSGCQNQPAMTVMNAADSTAFADATSGIDTEGSPIVDTDTSLSYQPTDVLIERLSNTDGVQYLSGNYKGAMGTADNPGVFFIEEPTKLTGGIEEGYGILVIRSSGEMSYDSLGTEVSVAGNFKFNGLVIFENAYNFKGRGTPTINGSVLIGNTENYSGPPLNIDISGNIHIQYDCRGENYARMAAADAVKQNKYTRVVTYEN